MWKTFDNTPYEIRIAKENVMFKDIFLFLDSVAYYEKMELALPTNKNKIIDDFINEKFIKKNVLGNYDVTNMGVLLISKNLKIFENLSHKTVRIIWYKDNNRLNTIREKEFNCGYAVDYNKIIEYLLTIILQEEVLEGSIRKTRLGYLEIAIRELLANIMIHIKQ